MGRGHGAAPGLAPRAHTGGGPTLPWGLTLRALRGCPHCLERGLRPSASFLDLADDVPVPGGQLQAGPLTWVSGQRQGDTARGADDFARPPHTLARAPVFPRKLLLFPEPHSRFPPLWDLPSCVGSFLTRASLQTSVVTLARSPAHAPRRGRPRPPSVHLGAGVRLRLAPGRSSASSVTGGHGGRASCGGGGPHLGPLAL